VAFRPDRPRDDGRPLDRGIAYVVVTISDGRLIELKGCADRAAAMTYAQTGTTGAGEGPIPEGNNEPRAAGSAGRCGIVGRVS
jgi:hypothetical protein